MPVRHWYQEGRKEKDIGIEKVYGDCGLLAYEKVDEEPHYESSYYKVTTFVVNTENIRYNYYYLTASDFEHFIEGFSGTYERISDVRPITNEDFEEEIDEFKDRIEKNE